MMMVHTYPWLTFFFHAPLLQGAPPSPNDSVPGLRPVPQHAPSLIAPDAILDVLPCDLPYSLRFSPSEPRSIDQLDLLIRHLTSPHQITSYIQCTVSCQPHLPQPYKLLQPANQTHHSHGIGNPLALQLPYRAILFCFLSIPPNTNTKNTSIPKTLITHDLNYWRF